MIAARTLARRESDYPPEVPRDLPASCAALFDRDDAVTVSAEDAEAFRRWAEQIEGWRTGPEHAREPFTFHEVD